MRYTLLLALFIGIISCDSSQPITQGNEDLPTEPEMLEESPICIDITNLRNIKDTNELAKTNILDFEINEGCVCVTYEYSGCNPGEPMIVWDGTATRSMRPTVRMNVYVKEAGMCDQLLKTTTCFNMLEMHSLGTQVLVYLNGSDKNFLINSMDEPLKTD